MILNNLPDSVVIVHPSKATDEYGNEATVFDINKSFTITKGWLQREIGSGGESLGQERSADTLIFRLYLPKGANISVRDRVQINDETFEVYGEPVVMRGMRGSSHIRARLRQVIG